MSKNLPTWHTEAIAQGIDYIVLFYGKAEGFVFCPSNLELPFRVGGDYNGNWPISAKYALEYSQKYLHISFNNEFNWMTEFIEKIINNQDFSLSELEIEIGRASCRERV